MIAFVLSFVPNGHFTFADFEALLKDKDNIAELLKKDIKVLLTEVKFVRSLFPAAFRYITMEETETRLCQQVEKKTLCSSVTNLSDAYVNEVSDSLAKQFCGVGKKELSREINPRYAPAGFNKFQLSEQCVLRKKVQIYVQVAVKMRFKKELTHLWPSAMFLKVHQDLQKHCEAQVKWTGILKPFSKFVFID